MRPFIDILKLPKNSWNLYVVQSLSHVQLFATPWTTTHRPSVLKKLLENLYETLSELKERAPTWFSLKEVVEEKLSIPAKSGLLNKSVKYQNNIVRKRGLC